MKLGCILMAAGASRRFGQENKLLAPFCGKPLYQHAFAAIPKDAFSAVVVVSHYEEILAAAEKEGFLPVYNPAPEDGVSLTIRLGLHALPDSDGAMFLVADQPLLKGETVKALTACFLEEPGCIVAPAFLERRGNPVVFPKEYFPELLTLSGDRGGSAVIRQHADALRLFPLDDEKELFDVDTAAALSSLTI